MGLCQRRRGVIDRLILRALPPGQMAGVRRLNDCDSSAPGGDPPLGGLDLNAT
jgi:hypothetical protein